MQQISLYQNSMKHKPKRKLEEMMNDFCPFIYDEDCQNPEYRVCFDCFGNYLNCGYYWKAQLKKRKAKGLNSSYN